MQEPGGRCPRRGGRSAHLTAGLADGQVQDAAERRDEEDDDLPRSSAGRVSGCLGQAARPGDLEPDSQADKEQGGKARATTTSTTSSPVISALREFELSITLL